MIKIARVTGNEVQIYQHVQYQVCYVFCGYWSPLRM